MHKISVENLTYSYVANGQLQPPAIENVSFAADEGELVGIIGHTGSGKSTLVQNLNGLLKPTSGSVLLDGKSIWENPKEMRKIRTRVGLVFQYPEYQLFEETVYKDIAFAAKNAGFDEKETDRLVREAAAFAGVDAELFEKSPFEISGGQKRRVAIAGVMSMKPEVLVLDEPTAGLDPRGRDEILTRISAYCRQNKTTVIIVSHSMEDVAKYADKVLVMSHGKVAMFDDCETVFTKNDELRAAGMQIPQVTQIFENLRQRGIEVEKSVFTVPYAVKLLQRKIGGVKDV